MLLLGAFAALALTLILGVALVSAAAPTVTIEPASEIGVTSALAEGEVNPEEKETNCHFEYATQAQFEASEWGEAGQAGCTGNPLSGNTAQPVEATLTGLAPATLYHLRLVAENNEGERAEEVAPTFETDPATAPSVAQTGSSEVSYTTAKLEGTIDPEGGNANPIEGTLPIGWQLQYAPASEAEPRNWQNANAEGEDPLEGAQAESSSPIALSAEAAGLTIATEYAFRLVAIYAGGLEALSPTQGTFTTLAVTKPTVSVDPVTTFTDSTAHLVGHVNPNAPEAEGSTSPAEQAAFETSWHFECVAPGPSCGTLSGAAVPAGNGAKEVKADASGLEPNTAYYVKLVASNLGGTEEATTAASPSFTTTAIAPAVSAFAAGPVQSDRADLNGQVNPHNSATEYWFEWGTADCSANPCQALPAGEDGDAGSGGIYTFVSQQLSGLSPSTTYHFRLLAKNASGTTEGDDQTFTTAATAPPCSNSGALGAGFLPDCRAWEMVSPPDKHGGNVAAVSNQTHAAADGDAATFLSSVGFGDVQGGDLGVEYMARRDSAPGTNGWSTHAITPTKSPTFVVAVGLQKVAPGYMGEFSADLSHAAFLSMRPLTEDASAAGAVNLYLRSDLGTPGAGSYELLTDSLAPTSSLPPVLHLLLGEPFFAGASSDFSHLIFETKLGLTEEGPSAPLGEVKLYENAGGTVRVVGRVPVEPATSCDDAGSPAVQCAQAESSEAGVAAGANGVQNYSSRMISADGSRIYFQSPTNSGGPGNIYLREDGARTFLLNVDESEPFETPAGEAQLWDASRDGSRVFFTTTESLVEEDEDGGFPDLYMYEVEKPEGERLTLLSGDLGASYVIGASDDGHYVYFIDDAHGVRLWHDGQISYIGRFFDANETGLNSPRTLWFTSTQQKTSRVTPDGHRLLFMTKSDEGFQGIGGFGGYDHGSTAACDHGDNGLSGCHELYTYDAETHQLRCASCNPTGATATGNALDDVHADPGPIPTTSHLSHALSDDGRYVFFSSAERLVPEDTNGTWDAYVYDTTTEEARLLSSGEDKEPSYFLDASADGSDVFIATAQKLSRWDTDTSYDLYDARVDGGVPEPVPPPPSCQGDACQPTPIQLNDPTPASSSFRGAGNPNPRKPSPRCARGKRRVKTRGGRSRCVKRHSAKQHRTAKHNRRAGR